MNCTPSARIEETKSDSESDAAAQGTAAHELAEHKLRQALGIDVTSPTSDWQDQTARQHLRDHVARRRPQHLGGRGARPGSEARRRR
ncbi:hypothetical protein CYJ76_11725 [Kytococcus schroeteri]|uniref:Uncharacterized protein n=1 Tax=Kytococcus schroeteri TaxID=138300 RepID=A0A2I1P7X2_9MICO|nr:hypothetical protein CYJ76_11725 [Kytococcus schroeteri]